MSRIYVALGDSLTAGRGDLAPDGRPLGFALRLSRMLSERMGVAHTFTNLAADRATVDEVLAGQLPELAGLRPDLVTVTVGMNDIRGTFEPAAFTAKLDEVLRQAVATRAVVATMTLPDIVTMLPIPKELFEVARELIEQVNRAIRACSEKHGVRYVNAWAAKEVAQRGFWSDDRLHPSTSGHKLIAEAFADLLLPDAAPPRNAATVVSAP